MNLQSYKRYVVSPRGETFSTVMKGFKVMVKTSECKQFSGTPCMIKEDTMYDGWHPAPSVAEEAVHHYSQGDLQEPPLNPEWLI